MERFCGRVKGNVFSCCTQLLCYIELFYGSSFHLGIVLFERLNLFAAGISFVCPFEAELCSSTSRSLYLRRQPRNEMRL